MNNHYPIRVLHVLASMNLGGAETLLMTIYRQIDRSYVQFDFALSSKNQGAYDSEIESLGGKIFHYPKYQFTNHFIYIKWWKSFLSSHPEYRIIHGHIGSTASIYLRIAKKNGVFCIAHSHNTMSNFSLYTTVYNLYRYPTRYIADYFFGCSRQAIIDRYGKRIANDSNKSNVLNNAIDAKQFIFSPLVRDEVRRELHLESDLLVLGTVARITIQKNPMMIVRIVESLAKKVNHFIFLWIGKGNMEVEVKNEISRLGLEKYFMFLGKRADVNRMLQALDIFLFPSIYEGLGIACVEAQAAGLPTLCSEAIPQEAKLTDAFYYLPLNDVNAWCDKILQVRNNSRKNNYQIIVNKGYDIKSVSLYLQDFYLGLSTINK